MVPAIERAAIHTTSPRRSDRYALDRVFRSAIS
jgi:hypothetical protein